jgi:hypothetical protein
MLLKKRAPILGGKFIKIFKAVSLCGQVFFQLRIAL